MKQTRIDIPDLSRIVEIAQTAARIAGDYLLQKRGSAHVVSHKSIRDDVLNVDVEAERFILATLQKETPHMGILSEEAGR